MDENNDWIDAIWEACEPADKWMARKFVTNLLDHKRKYPNFIPERVAEMFIAAPLKTRGYYCYQPVSTFTKSIHKRNSFASFARSQS